MEPMPLSFTGIIHYPRLKDRLATHFVPFSEFEKDAAAGTLPDLSLIEPNMTEGMGTITPRSGGQFRQAVDIAMDPPSSILLGEVFLERVFNAYRSATSASGTNVWNTALLIGWDEPGGTYDHVAPGPVPPPDPATPEGEFGFTFDRSGYRVPAILVSPWVEPGAVYNEEYRHTSLIATLRKAWNLGEAFTQRDAAARTFDHVFTRGLARDPEVGHLRCPPVPEWTMDPRSWAKPSAASESRGPGLIEKARGLGANSRRNSTIPTELTRTHRRSPQGCLLALLPGVGSGRREATERTIRGGRLGSAVVRRESPPDVCALPADR